MSIDNLPLSDTMIVLDQFGVGGQMCISFWCGGLHCAEPNTYGHVNWAAFEWRRETDAVREYLRSLPDMAKAIVSL
jgi:hypothetical protein